MVRRKMFRILYVVCLFLVLGISPVKAYSQGMSTYCATPPFLVSSVTPNVLFIVDNSGSMKYPAYWPSNLSKKKVDSSFDSNFKYYGIFDPNSQYSYDDSGNYFYKDTNGDWSGKFLNWLTMRRYDILLKILIGGNYKKIDNNDFLQGFNTIEKHAYYLYPNGYKFKKKYDEDESDNYFPYDYNDDTFYVGVDYDGSNKTRNDRYWFKVDGDEYAIRVKINGKPTGILQNIAKKVRVGLMVYNHGAQYEDDDGRGDGGKVVSYISDNNTNLASLYSDQDIYDKNKYPNATPKGYPPLYPHNWTPLAETYYEAIRYFEAAQSAYNDGVDYSNHDPIQYRCQKNFVILITDGESTKDMNVPGTCFWGYTWPVSDSNFDVKTWMNKIANEEGYSTQWCSTLSSDGTYYLEGASYYSHVSDLRSDLPGKQNLTLYVVYTFGKSSKARDLLQKSAKYGGFVDSDNNSKPNLSKEWDNNGDSIPDNYFEAQDGYKIEKDINGAISNILKKTTSGTAASVLSEKERVNAGILQAAFYPQKVFTQGSSSKTISWAGSLYNWWFYETETGSNFVSNIREDTIENKDLDICSNGVAGGDYIINYEFEDNKLKIKAYKSLCSGDNASSTPDAVYDGLDEAHPVWEAGRILAEENPMDRKIYTYVGGTQPTSVENLVELKSLTNRSSKHYSKLFGDEDADGVIDDSAETIKYAKAITFSNLKSYIYGVDIPGYRTRKIDTSGDVWKLGDIIYSTPKIVNYDNYTMAFVGANDGMLHAFRVGKYRFDRLGAYQLSKLRNDRFTEDINSLGKEEWAFIPKNSLPYLRFLADPDYRHMYYVDLTPTIFGLDTNGDGVIDKRILIGGMRLGGAVGCGNSSVCVKPPLDTCDNASAYAPNKDPMVSTSNYCLGLSSYFALDITDPTQPKFLWEFTNKDLGFSYSGPTLVKRKIGNSFNDYDYYVIFASGPTNYNGDVGQKLKLFVLSLNSDFTISSTHTINVSDKLGLGYAFSGRMSKEGIVDKGSTKAVFFGVVYKNGDDWKGNVIGVKPDDDNPANWTMFKLFSNPIGPVVVPISYYKCNVNGSKKGFLYFGSGRYFFKDDDPGSDSSDIERLYGVKIEKCLNSDGSTYCTLNNGSNLHMSNASCYHISDDLYGWYQNLNPSGYGYNKERDITGTTNSTMDAIFFTTTEPTSDICGFGGRSRMWGMNCATGESLIHQTCSTTGRVAGTLLLQTSVGKITKFDMDINPQEPKKSKNPFVKENDKATKWTVGTAPPNKQPVDEGPARNPAEILYEIEK